MARATRARASGGKLIVGEEEDGETGWPQAAQKRLDSRRGLPQAAQVLGAAIGKD